MLSSVQTSGLPILPTKAWKPGWKLSKRNELQRSRHLFRLRLNLNYTLDDHFYATVGVSTNGEADSQNQPLTEGFDDYGVYLHQFLLGWNATPWASFVLGKQFAPFYNNEDAVVDFSDITPGGVTEKFNWAVTPRLNVAVNLGQHIFYDNPGSRTARPGWPVCS